MTFTCPICGVISDASRFSGMDAHHWRYGDDEDVSFYCSDCHRNVIHRHGTVTELSHMAGANKGYRTWRDVAVYSILRYRIDAAGRGRGFPLWHEQAAKLKLPAWYEPSAAVALTALEYNPEMVFL